MGRLSGEVALITGGGAGIGAAVARRYVEEGASVVIIDRDRERAEKIATELGSAVSAIVGDVAEPQLAARAVETAVAHFGSLSILIGNAGIFDYHRRLARMSAAELTNGYRELFDANVLGQLLIAREAHDEIAKVKGCVIFTCSVASFRGGGGGALYTASKFAVRGLVMELAHEWAPAIRVNGVAPGGTRTKLSGLEALGSGSRTLDSDQRTVEAIGAATPLGFIAEPHHHTGLYVTLADRRDAAQVTGAVVVSDGGLLAAV